MIFDNSENIKKNQMHCIIFFFNTSFIVHFNVFKILNFASLSYRKHAKLVSLHYMKQEKLR